MAVVVLAAANFKIVNINIEVKWMLPFGNSVEIGMELLEMEVVEEVTAQSYPATVVVEQLVLFF